MLSQNIASKQANKDEGHERVGGGSGRKTSSLRPPDQILKCPRCDSPNTKFCYYNNYSLTQPRHFCKACRRYWTKGGALRNVPVGGSCRKNKKTKSSCSSRSFLADFTSKGSSSSDIGGMKFYGLSAIDFQPGGLNLPPPRVTATTNQLISSSYGDTSSINSNSFDPLGLTFPFLSSHIVMKQGDHHRQNFQSGGLASFHEMGTSNNIHLHQNTHDLASSIESLSSINQDLHWKLQQQRLAMLYGGGGGRENINQQQKEVVVEPQAQKLQPILFQNLETSKAAAHESSMDGDSRIDGAAGGSSGLATEWFFDNSSYAPPLNLNPSTPTNSNSAGNNDQNGISMNNNWNGMHQAWNHFS